MSLHTLLPVWRPDISVVICPLRHPVAVIDIYDTRMGYVELRRNPLRKISAQVVANAVDEKIEE